MADDQCATTTSGQRSMEEAINDAMTPGQTSTLRDLCIGLVPPKMVRQPHPFLNLVPPELSHPPHTALDLLRTLRDKGAYDDSNTEFLHLMFSVPSLQSLLKHLPPCRQVGMMPTLRFNVQMMKFSEGMAKHQFQEFKDILKERVYYTPDIERLTTAYEIVNELCKWGLVKVTNCNLLHYVVSNSKWLGQLEEHLPPMVDYDPDDRSFIRMYGPWFEDMSMVMSRSQFSTFKRLCGEYLPDDMLENSTNATDVLTALHAAKKITPCGGHKLLISVIWSDESLQPLVCLLLNNKERPSDRFLGMLTRVHAHLGMDAKRLERFKTLCSDFIPTDSLNKMDGYLVLVELVALGKIGLGDYKFLRDMFAGDAVLKDLEEVLW